MAAARAAYEAALDGGITAAEEAEIDRLIAYAEQGVTTYRDVKDATADALGNALATAAGIVTIWAGGSGGALVFGMLRAGGSAAVGEVVGHVVVSGQSYEVEALPGHLLEGFVNGATVPLTFAGLPNAATPWGRLIQGARAGALEGVAGGFAGGIVGALIQDGIWQEGLWQGLIQVGAQGLLGAMTGGLTGGALGGFLGQFWHECFPAGTPVHAEDGLRAIETVKAGDRVWAYNFRVGGWELRPVVQPLRYDYRGDMVTLTAGGERIEATGHHPFWVIEGEGLGGRPKPQHVEKDEPGNAGTPGRWVDARDLRVHDRVLMRSGATAEVTAVAARADALPVYNLHVADLNNYAVGVAGVLVHNRKHHMPREREGGSWNGTRVGDADNGTFTITDEEVRLAAQQPGQPIPASVSVVYRDRHPDFGPLVREIDGVRGEVQITMSVDATVLRPARVKQDMAAADEAFAAILNREGRPPNPDTGNPWTADDVRNYRDRHQLNWHHHENVNFTTYQCNMQLVPVTINDAFHHTGSRKVLDKHLGLPDGKR